MATIIKMPEVMAGETEAVLQSWEVSVGDAVQAGQAVAGIETDKAVIDLEAEEAGTVGRLLVSEGDSVEVGAPVAVLLADGDTEQAMDQILAGMDTAPGSADDSTANEAHEPASTSAPGASASDPSPAAATEAPPASSPASEQTPERILASPLARRRARETGLNLAALHGSGPGGRIIRSDVEAAAGQAAPGGTTAAAAQASTPNQAAAPQTDETDQGDRYQDVALTGMRRAIARRLSESQATVPHFYLSAEVAMDELLELRQQVNQTLARSDRKASVNDLILKALAAALVDVPEANASWQEQAIRYYRDVDIAMAIATEGGLLTPVVKNVAERRLAAVVDDTRNIKQRAETGRIKQPELEGGAFSLTNLGMYGIREFYAVINPPQAGILAAGAMEQRPVVRAGQVTAATLMTLTLSADHRIIDGTVAARLLNAVQRHLQDPLSILV